jgi:hypothetical protein
MDNQANCPLVLRANRPSIDPVYFGFTDFRSNEFSDYLASRLFLLQIICQFKCRNTKFSSQNYYMMEDGTISFPIALLDLHLKNKEIQ